MLGEKIKITGWLEKLKQIKNHIDIEYAPTITLFNIINITLFNRRLKLKPEEWRDEDKKKIAEFLSEKIGITLKEFEELLEKEIKEVSEEEQKSIQEQLDQFSKLLTRLLVEDPLIPLEEFERRSEIKPMLKYEFIGRESELEKLRKFLESDEKVFLLTGDGGVGKTRLAIEFARELKASDKWDAYFIDQEREFKYSVVSNVLGNKNTLLILDDASRYHNRDRVIGFIRNPPEGGNIKLLLIERAIFEDSTENTLREKEIPFQSYELGRGDIVTFLKKYFGIEDEVAEAIEKECMNSFVFAAFFGEFYKEEGRVGTLKEVLKNRTEKYIKDIEIATKIPFRDVKNIIYLLSLITPVKEKYLKHFKEIFEELWDFNYEHLKKIIGLAGESNIIAEYGEESDEEYAIKPDPVADYLRAEFMEDKIFKKVVMKFLPFVPLNISYNIFVTQRFAGVSSEVSQILGEIWAKLNEIEGRTPEYFSALVLFTGDFSSFPFFDVEKINISHWVSCYEKVSKNYQEKEVREELAASLVNATFYYAFYYGRKNKLGKIDECLKELRGLHERYPEKEVREKLAKGLVNATNDYGRKKEFKKMEGCLKELRELHEKYPEKEVRKKLAEGLFNATIYYRRADKFDKTPYENLILLYRLRFDLPEDSMKERRIKIIENWFAKATKRKMEEIYNKKEDLRGFLNFLKAELGDTEIMLLMNEICKEPDIRIQKKLWALLLESLNSG